MIETWLNIKCDKVKIKNINGVNVKLGLIGYLKSKNKIIFLKMCKICTIAHNFKDRLLTFKKYYFNESFK